MVEEVVARFGDRAVLAVFDRLLFGRELGGFVGGRVGAGEDQLLVLGAFGVAAGVFPAFFGLFQGARRGLLPRAAADHPLGPDQVRLPVVEVELRGGADLVDRPLALVMSGQADRDLVGAQARDFRLGDAELVDPLADDLDRAFDVFAADRLHRPVGCPW